MIWHLLTAVLVVLKLTGYIAASWWLVVAPSLIVSLVGIVMALIGVYVVMKAQ